MVAPVAGIGTISFMLAVSGQKLFLHNGDLE